MTKHQCDRQSAAVANTPLHTGKSPLLLGEMLHEWIRIIN